MGKDSNTQVAHGDNVGRGGSGAGAFRRAGEDGQQGAIVVRDDDAHAQGAADKEEGEAGVGRLEGGLEICARQLRLARHHGDVFGPDNSKGSAPHGTKEAFESTEVAGRNVLGESTGILPITKTVRVVFGVAADHGNECKGKDDTEEGNLSGGQPELGLSVPLDGKHVDGAERQAGQ